MHHSLSKRRLLSALLLLALLGGGAAWARWHSAPTPAPNTITWLGANLEKLEYVAEPGERAGGESEDLISRDAYFQARYTYPTGRADRAWLFAAAQQDKGVPANVPAGEITYRQERRQSPLVLNPLAWTSIGPRPQQSNTCAPPCFIFNEVAGRVNDIVIDPISPTIAYIASDGGGVWKTTNCCTAATTWAPTTDNPLITTSAIGDLSVDRSSGTVYAGTGDLRFGSFSFGSAGLLKSTNQGASWEIKGAEVFGPYYPQPPGSYPQYNSIGKVEPDPANPNKVIVGSKLGVYLSYNGGDTWTGPCLPDPFPTQRQDITALRVHTTTMGATNLIVAVGARGISTTVQSNLGENGANGIYKATVPASGCPVDWQLLSRPDNGWPTGTGSGIPGYQAGGNVVGRIDLALAPSNPNYIYAQVQAVKAQASCDGATGCQLGLWRSTDGGVTWQQRSDGETLNRDGDTCGPVCLAIPSVCGDYPQNWYDQNIIVHPTNPDTIFFQNQNLWRSTDGGLTLKDLTCGYGTIDVPPPAGVHVDNHAMAFVPGSNTLMAGSDGGVYITLDATLPQPIFNNLNSSLSTIEFYSGDITANFATDPLPAAVAGAQDNGSSVWTGDPNLGPFTWSQRLGGDGMYARFDPITEKAYMESQNGNLNLFGPLATGAGVAVAGDWGSDTLSFVFPYEIYKGVPPLTPGGGEDCPLTGCVHMIAGSNRVWETIAGGLPDGSSWYPNSPTLTKNTLGNRSFINQLAFAFRTDDLAIVGTNDGNVQVGRNLGQGFANSATWVDVTGGNTVLPNRPILDVALDPAVLTSTTGLIGYAAAGGFDQNTPGQPGHVFRLSCGANVTGCTWTNKSGNLPNIPVNAITANPRFPQQVFAGSDWGVYYTNDITVASPVWNKFSAGMPSVMIWDFAVDRGFTTLAAFTRSRGAYVWPLPAAPFVGTPVPTVTGSPGPIDTPVVPPSYTPRPPASPTLTFTPPPSPTPLGCGQTLLLSEGFESGTLGAFTAVAITGTIPWAADNTLAHTGIWAAHVPDPNELSDQRLEQTSAVSLPAGALAAQLQFWHRYAFENETVPYDGAVLEYSTNNGAAWTDAGTLITEGNYNGIILVGADNPLGGRPGWINRNSAYPAFQRVTVDLSSLIGQSVKFRFREGSDQNTGDTGWWVDDVTILATNPCASPTPSPTPCMQQLQGHLTYQGLAQPNAANAQAVELRLQSTGGGPVSIYNATTDANGNFSVNLGPRPPGTYNWWLKSPRYLARSGTLTLTNACVAGQEFGTQPAGDITNDNCVNIDDFTLLRATFGLVCGDPGYDARADYTGDCLVDITDFTLLRSNFGACGPAAPAGPGAPPKK